MNEDSYILGTALKITTLVDVDTATTALITIKDPSLGIMVNNVSMTREASGVYSYTYQSGANNAEGTYVATISITYGGYTSIAQEEFSFRKQDYNP